MVSFVKEVEGRPWVDCAYAGCRSRAIIRKTLKGSSFTNLCLEHYDDQNLEEVLKWNHDNGLETEEQRKKYVFETPFAFKKI